MQVKFKRCRQGARPPVFQHKGDAGADLAAAEERIVRPGCIVKVATGIALEIPQGYFGRISPRSGLALRGLIAIEGTIDYTYRGEIAVILQNVSARAQIIREGDRIAQIIFLRYMGTTFVEADDLAETDRGQRGFGSTGLDSPPPPVLSRSQNDAEK